MFIFRLELYLWSCIFGVRVTVGVRVIGLVLGLALSLELGLGLVS